MTAKKLHDTREAWLNAAADRLNDLIAEKTDLKPSSRVLVSAGWPRRDKGGKVIGQCYPSKTSMGVNHVFISPTQSSPTRVLDILLHELVHAADDCQNQHKGPFTRAIRALGLEGKPTATTAGKDLTVTLKGIVKDLGPYPHTVLTPGDYGPAKPQTTRMLKVECPECGCVIRMTRKWLDEAGTPRCGCKRQRDAIKMVEVA
jgi:hypothetical protein